MALNVLNSSDQMGGGGHKPATPHSSCRLHNSPESGGIAVGRRNCWFPCGGVGMINSTHSWVGLRDEAQHDTASGNVGLPGVTPTCYGWSPRWGVGMIDSTRSQVGLRHEAQHDTASGNVGLPGVSPTCYGWFPRWSVGAPENSRTISRISAGRPPVDCPVWRHFPGPGRPSSAIRG